jgi:2-(1,2-epoxy-1,2-dihydrophenyl)acetyl-CoA isomerase
MAVTSERRGAVTVLTLSRPGALNAIDLPLLQELLGALAETERSGAAAVVLTGAGGMFCAGADLSYVTGTLDDDVAATLDPLVVALHAVIRALRVLPVPLIAAVEGPAVGAAIGLALSADLRVLGRTARLVPGYLRIGASPDGGVSWLLTRAIGGPRTTALMLRNRAIDASEAGRLGLADERIREIWGGPDFAEGVRAFLEKRRPQFTGG